MQIITPRGQTAFVHVFRPQPAMQEGKEPQYSVTLLWPEGEAKLKELEDAIVKVAESKFGSKAKQMLAKGQLRSPLRPGSDKEDTKAAEDFEGKVFLTARSTDKPQVVDKDVEPVMDQFDVYSGCVGRADIYLFPYDKAGNRGVGAILNSFQKLGDGERKSGRRAAADAFGGADDDGDDQDDGDLV
jgi:hypothetical protein